tara:strand:+ start:370 stop:504 length:135 start_codon:yes stop_codon:yes gene_type:complete
MGFLDSLWKNWGKKDVKGWKAPAKKSSAKVKKTVKKKTKKAKKK